MKKEYKEYKLQYLYASLNDLQSTIRAVDTKVSYLFVILFLPCVKLGVIYAKIKGMLLHEEHCLVVASGILAFLFTLVWIIGFWCALRTIIAIDDPKQHIDGERPESTFYPAKLFKYSFWNVIGFTKSQSTSQFKKHYDSIPEDYDEIAKQLTLEQMKAMYIASLKIKRSVFAYYSVITWIILGGILWFLHLLFG